MNINPNRGKRCKEKKMNAGSRTISAAMLITLGLTLSGNAAEGAATMSVTDGKKVWWILDPKTSSFCFDLDSGKEVWAIVGRGNTWATPILADGKVISPWNDARRSGWAILDATTGKELFMALCAPNGPSYASPAISEGILVTRGNKNLYGYDLRKP